MDSLGCPNRETLGSYAAGALSEAESTAIAHHVEACGNCRAVMARLRSSAVVEATIAGGSASASASSAAGAEPQQRLGEYELLAKLGEGGMGAVYKARHVKLKRVVALKVLPRDRTQDAQAVSRFEREMEAVGQLDHVHIVRRHDAREIEGTHFLVMEYVEGRDFSVVLERNGPLKIADACEAVRQAAAGLQYAYEHALVHRDIKPSNLMLSSTGQVKILDLGLARLSVERPEGELTGTGQAMGTADYMAPEQVTDSHSVDIRADVYSLGCTLYKLLTAQVPYHAAKYRTATSKIVAHVTDPIPPLRGLRPEVPKELAAALERMLAKNPEERFATPAAVVSALERLARGADLAALYTAMAQPRPAAGGAELVATQPQASSAVTDTSRPQAAGIAATATGAAAATRQPRSRLSRWRFVPWIAGAASIAIIALGVIVRIRDRDENVVAEIKVPAGGSVEVADDGKGEKAAGSLPSQISNSGSQNSPAAPPPVAIGQWFSPLTPDLRGWGRFRDRRVEVVRDGTIRLDGSSAACYRIEAKDMSIRG